MKNKSVKIAVLSGKGGTGKTLVSVNLASVAGSSVYIDCDVEEPNGYLLFKPEITLEECITVRKPFFNESMCVACRKCVDFCKFGALAFIKNKPYLFEDVCHSCGGCALLCPEKAISQRDKIIGKVQEGVSRNVTVKTGIQNIGQSSGTPIIKKLLEGSASENLPVFIDCPPGSACIVMDSIKDADYCVLVAEPTVFGVHNLKMVCDLVNLFQKPHGVVLNKCLDSDNPAETFCNENSIPILGQIPFDNKLGKLNSDAKIAARESEKFKNLFSTLYENVMKGVQHETDANSQR